jgi:site-specific DNA recombinase
VLRHGPEACPGAWLSKSKIEDFVINRLKERVLTEENLTDLVGLVNEEMKLLESHKRDRLGEIEKELESVNQKLLKYHLAFEKGSMRGEDAAPRIRELRSEQTRLQRMSDEALALLDHSDLQTIDAKQLLDYVGYLKDLLSKGTLMERKSFLRSFVKRIGFEPGQVSIDYTIPMHAEQDGTCDREVLSIKQVGSPSWIRTNNLAVNSRPLYR